MRFWHRKSGDAVEAGLHLVVGLGNPGAQYAKTRHNIGFMVVERLAERGRMQFRGSKLRADIAKGTIGETPVLLALPTTYMNESGNAVSRLLNYYRVPIQHLLIICDDLDLPFGSLRVRPQGSAGGQRGLQSIIQALGTSDFGRLRVGIGRPSIPAASYVLQPFAPDEASRLPGILDFAADAAATAVTDGIEVGMNRYNGRHA